MAWDEDDSDAEAGLDSDADDDMSLEVTLHRAKPVCDSALTSLAEPEWQAQIPSQSQIHCEACRSIGYQANEDGWRTSRCREKGYS
jgi:hypothetical protein